MTNPALKWLAAAAFTMSAPVPHPAPLNVTISDSDDSADAAPPDAEVDAARYRLTIDVTEEQMRELQAAADAAADALNKARKPPVEDE